MCAALQREGYVDASATKDSDALIFGATCVYHTINLQVRAQGQWQCCIFPIGIQYPKKRSALLFSSSDALKHNDARV